MSWRRDIVGVRHLAKPGRYHLCTACVPLVLVGNVKDQEVILARSFADFMSSLRGELDVVGLFGMTDDDAVETAVIFERSEHIEPKPPRVHLSDRGEVIGRPGYTHRRTRLHSEIHA